MKVAVEGCCHGCLDQIYKRLAKKKVDLLIICGDFQSIRNKTDLQSMSVPDKYKKFGDFQDYYNGKKRAPVFTIFVGGNHEASNYLEELKYGGFVAPKIFYMGRSSVVWYKGLRIGGLSGVYWEPDFMKLRPEHYEFPLQRSMIRSIYHYSKEDYFKLKLIDSSNKMVMISHDWPEGVYNHGNVKKLIEKKPFFKSDIKKRCLGSPFNMSLLQTIQPKYWFSAHLHVRFSALLSWQKNENKRKESDEFVESEVEIKKIKLETSNSDEIELDMCCSDDNGEVDSNDIRSDIKENPVSNVDEIALDIELESSDNEITNEEPTNTTETPEPEITKIEESADTVKILETDDNSLTDSEVTDELNSSEDSQTINTRFLALDKCLPRREYLEILDIDLTDENHISTKVKQQPFFYDHEYISAMRVVEKYKSKLDMLSYDELMNTDENILNEFLSLKEFYMKEYQTLDAGAYKSLFDIPLNGFMKTTEKNPENLQTKSFIEKFIQ